MNIDRVRQMLAYILLGASVGVSGFAYADAEVGSVESEIKNIQSEIKRLQETQEQMAEKLSRLHDAKLSYNADSTNIGKMTRRGRR